MKYYNIVWYFLFQCYVLFHVILVMNKNNDFVQKFSKRSRLENIFNLVYFINLTNRKLSDNVFD